MPASRSLLRAALAATVTGALTASTAGAQEYGVLDMAHSVLDQRCTVAPSSIAPTCVMEDGAAILTADGGRITGTARAEATHGGPLRAGMTVTAEGTEVGFVTAFARAGWYDALTVGSSDAAFARFFVSGDGTAGSSIGYANPLTSTYGIFYIANLGTASVPDSYGTVTMRVHQFTVPANAGTVSGYIDVPLSLGTNNLLIGFSAAALVGRPEGDEPWSGTVYADYTSTGWVTDMRILDADRVDISDRAGYGFASGLNYSTVPEPSTWALMGSGLLALGVMAARRRTSPAAG